MSKKMNNSTRIQGYVYEHKLELKTTGPNSKNPGTEYISGTLNIATDEEALNIVPIHYTYVTAVTSKGAPNQTFNTLKSIIDGKLGTIMSDGKENAAKVRIDSAFDLNEWYDSRNNDQLVSTKRNEGGFIHQVNEFTDDNHASFDVDMVITGTTRVEADEERGTPEKVVIKGCIFNFRGELLPFDFSAFDKRAMAYFEDLGATPKSPVFTRLQGEQKTYTVERVVTQESAFGEAAVRNIKTSRREFVVTWAQAEPYLWDDESTLLASELSEKMAARELHLAEIKKRRDDYLKSTASKPSAIADDNFDF